MVWVCRVCRVESFAHKATGIRAQVTYLRILKYTRCVTTLDRFLEESSSLLVTPHRETRQKSAICHVPSSDIRIRDVISFLEVF